MLTDECSDLCDCCRPEVHDTIDTTFFTQLQEIMRCKSGRCNNPKCLAQKTLLNAFLEYRDYSYLYVNDPDFLERLIPEIENLRGSVTLSEIDGKEAIIIKWDWNMFFM